MGLKMGFVEPLWPCYVKMDGAVLGLRSNNPRRDSGPMRKNGIMKSRNGFSLIEVAISIAVLGIIALAIVGYFQWSFGVFGYTDRKATAESMARSQMEKIKSDPWSDGGVYTSVSVSGYTISYTASNVAAGMQKITVTAFRNNVPADTVTLEGYKQNR
jgi:prepilin-type N-terminal cleavage/methylation domain-containing protein